MVLVVDDQPGVLRLLVEFLRGEAVEVETAASGPEALEKIKKGGVRLLLLDAKLPGMDGLTVWREARELDPALRVVLMTAYGETALEEEARALGIGHFLHKPFDLREVGFLVKSLLGQEEVARRGLA
ncbi:response regulator [Desulfovirgula thermocuniculi]|uniref:response regulator n=1 Tax=Desulfovirgula thermocuniculi TaxID=348842 RepID=UPI0003FE13E7|nr:response regulator [Desulfovirgula thermocuniculi]